ncbi:MAG: murein L,D-transpeptidase catalytic domain family protein [Bacteroidota bacterium]|nr:murein L,D-transpeptidase catalytic domain family protein [Bacteroidota bacterium]
MNKKSTVILFSFTLIFLCASIVLAAPNKEKNIVFITANSDANSINSKLIIYDSLQLNELGLSRAAFENAIKGYSYLLSSGKIKNENIISIIDFSLPSDKKRLFVIDLQNGELLFNTFVAHGKKSGEKLPTVFSNKIESKKSSLGFYVTGETYFGHRGYSLRLQGEEKGINDNAMRRGIVMHSAAYVDESIIEERGYIGRSFGCPAVPANLYKEIIETIQNGTCLFIYSPDKFYATHSKIIKQIKG